MKKEEEGKEGEEGEREKKEGEGEEREGEGEENEECEIMFGEEELKQIFFLWNSPLPITI
jgi:hypothetical protein